MIQALRYEPQGQQQRFEPREQQGSDAEQRHIHLHLNVHVHLNLGARRVRVRRLLQPTATRVEAIFAAFIGALSMALSFTIMAATSFHFIGPHIDLAMNIMTIGALLGSGAILLGGIPVLASAWRSTPRSRFLLLAPFLMALTLFLLTLLESRSRSSPVVSRRLALAFGQLSGLCLSPHQYHRDRARHSSSRDP